MYFSVFSTLPAYALKPDGQVVGVAVEWKNRSHFPYRPAATHPSVNEHAFAQSSVVMFMVETQ